MRVGEFCSIACKRKMAGHWGSSVNTWRCRARPDEKHLRILESANLVVVSWRGREKLHFLNPAPIHEIAERWIGKYERGRVRVLAELKKRLEGETDE